MEIREAGMLPVSTGGQTARFRRPARRVERRPARLLDETHLERMLWGKGTCVKSSGVGCRTPGVAAVIEARSLIAIDFWYQGL